MKTIKGKHLCKYNWISYSQLDFMITGVKTLI